MGYYLPDGNEAYNPMDIPAPSQEDSQMREFDRAEEVGIRASQVGTTSNPFEHQTQALKARIFHGASRVELTFMGANKSSKQSFTPESFGRRDREDMRALAEVNDVQTTTHATTAVMGLGGIQAQGDRLQISDEMQKMAIEEIK